MPYISGSPIIAYCTECKADREHVVLESAGTQIRSVRCKKCGSEGSFRAPREKARAALLDFSKKKKAPAKTRRKKAPPSPAVVYAELMDGLDLDAAVRYNIKKPLAVGDLMDHPKFGVGLVTEIIDVQKARVVFPEGERVMVCNRG